jgi:hypothetical protein
MNEIMKHCNNSYCNQGQKVNLFRPNLSFLAEA